MKKWNALLALALVVSMLFVGMPVAAAEGGILGGLSSMISGLLDDDAADTEETDGDEEEPADFYAAMDSYEAFVDKYVEFMKNYDENDFSDLGALTDYASMMAQYSETMEKLDDIDEDELTDDELAYYIDVMARIEKKLLELT